MSNIQLKVTAKYIFVELNRTIIDLVDWGWFYWWIVMDIFFQIRQCNANKLAVFFFHKTTCIVLLLVDLPCRWWAALSGYFPIRSALSRWPAPAHRRRRASRCQDWRWTWSTCRAWKRTSPAGFWWRGRTGSWSAGGGTAWTAPGTWSLLLL